MPHDEKPTSLPAEVLALDPVFISGLIEPIQTEGAVGGVNHAMINGHERGLMISIPPWLNMQGGDWIDVFWGNDDSPVTTGGVLPEQVGENVLMFIAAGKVPEGIHDLYYRITRNGSGNEENSTSLPILVRTRFPGGTDPNPELPGHQNLAAPDPKLPPNGIIDEDAAKAGVEVVIPAYPNMRLYDLISFYWGGVIVQHEVTQADIDAEQVKLLITEDTILEAGASDQLGLVYRVRDEVHNLSSDFSMVTQIIVEIGDNLFGAPLVINPDNDADPQNVIDLDKLGDDDLEVNVIAFDSSGLQRGDVITLLWTGTTAQGQPITVTPEPRTVNSMPAVLAFMIPNADVRGLAKGRGVASYTVTRDDSLVGGSKRGFVTFTGAEAGLPKPQVPDAVDGVLEPGLAQTVVVIPGQALEAGDIVYLEWLGTRANGSVLLYEDDRAVSGGGAGQPMNFTVPGQYIAPLDGGKVTVSYRLNKFSTGLDLESERLTLEVGEAGADLPAPTTRPPAEDGVIDPEQLPGELVIVIAPYPDMRAGQIVRLVWAASSGPHYGDWIPLSPSMVGEEVEFYIDSAKLGEYLGADVRVSYQVETEGEPTRVSDSTAFHVGQRELVLPLPEILEAEGNELNPDQVLDGATVEIAASARLVEGDEVTVWVIGNGEAGSAEITEPVLPGQGGKAFNLSIDHAVIEANRGGRFELKYSIQRKAGGEPEASGSVHYSVVNQVGNEPLHIMGARYSASQWRPSGGSRVLKALHQQTRQPVLAEWCYDGEYNWTKASRFEDEKPWLKLYVRNARETWECRSANIFGNGPSFMVEGLAALVAMRDEVPSDNGVKVDLVAWGDGRQGGSLPSHVQPVDNVAEVSAAGYAFSARLRDGSAVSWGYEEHGGEPKVLPGEFTQIRSNGDGFVGIKKDGKLYAWGHPDGGAPVPDPVLQHTDHLELKGTYHAHATRRANGQCMAWGHPNSGGSMHAGQDEFDDIVQLVSNEGAFAALRDLGETTQVIAWGNERYGGNAPEFITALTNVKKFCASTKNTFCVQLESGELKVWPTTGHAGKIPTDIAKRTDIVEVVANGFAYCVLLSSGKVLAWGGSGYGGDLPGEVAALSNIVQIAGSDQAFAVLCGDGMVYAWGNPEGGGKIIPQIPDGVCDAQAIYANAGAFVALTEDGEVKTWGATRCGGDSSHVQHLLRGKVTHSRLLSAAEAAAVAKKAHAGS